MNDMNNQQGTAETSEQKRGRLAKVRREARAQIIGYILAALGLVAGLAWNEAIKGFIEQFFKGSGSLTAKFLYAIVITILVVIVSMGLLRLKPKDEEKN